MWGVRDTNPYTVENLLMTFWLPPNLTTVPWYASGIGSRTPCRYQAPQMLKSLIYNGVTFAFNLYWYIGYSRVHLCRFGVEHGMWQILVLLLGTFWDLFKSKVGRFRRCETWGYSGPTVLSICIFLWIMLQWPWGYRYLFKIPISFPLIYTQKEDFWFIW